MGWMGTVSLVMLQGHLFASANFLVWVVELMPDMTVAKDHGNHMQGNQGTNTVVFSN